MFLKQHDPMVLEKKVNTTPVDYAVLNQLSRDFEKRSVPQIELSAEQAFWSQNFRNSSDPSLLVDPPKSRFQNNFLKSAWTYTLGTSRSNSGKQITVICYNYKGEGHMSKQCTKPKIKRDDSWLKDKVLLVQAQANDQILHETELAFLADPGIIKDALVEVHNPDNVDNNTINQSVQVMPSSEQSNVVNHLETKITSDSNIIPYSQYVTESQQAAVQNSNSSAQQDALILYVFSLRILVLLMLAEESRSKMFLKQHDPMVLEKKVNTTPVDYAVLNQLSRDFEKRSVPQIELSAEQAFWSQNFRNSSDPSLLVDPPKSRFQNNFLKSAWVSNHIAENEHLKHTYKQLYDSIKPTRVRSKEQHDALINQVHQKSVEILDINVSLQDKVLIITTLKDKLRKLKGKALVDTTPIIALEMLLINVEPIDPRLLNNRTVHSDYLRLTQE
nr:hypothetical protein [Tanacetum cinerariifolium]